MKNERTSVPSFYVELVRYLEFKGLKEEGILRVPGNAGRVKVENPLLLFLVIEKVQIN